jgi:hypothetical protein
MKRLVIVVAETYRKTLFFLFLLVANVFAMEVDCHLKQHVLDMYGDDSPAECFFVQSTNTWAIYTKDGGMYLILYDHDAETLCLHLGKGTCSTYYECATKDLSSGLSSTYCQTKKKALEIKKRLRDAK